MRQKLLNYTLIFALVYGTTPYSFAAGIVETDGTIGAAAQVIDLTDVGSGALDTYDLVETLGERHGDNLFHSFLTFNIQELETAQFSGDPLISNVISRVTGGSASLIDGTIRNTIAGSGFWFVNTAGVMISSTAVFDVSGALGIGATDFIRFDDLAQFHVIPGNGDALSTLTANPVDFGFVGAPSVDSNLTITGLTLPETGTGLGSGVGDITLAGGTVTITGSSISNVPEASGSDINISSPGAILLDGTTLKTSTTNDFNAGNITVDGGSVSIVNGTFVTSTASSVDDPLTLTVDESVLDPDSLVLGSIGKSGDISITGATGVTSNIDAVLGVPTGNAANTISTAANNEDSVGAGTVTITATTGDVFLSGATVESTTLTNLTAVDGGVTGAVSLNADGAAASLKLNGITVGTSTEGTANAGNVTLTGNAVAIDNGTSITSTASSVDDPATAGVDESILDPDATAPGSIGQTGNISIIGATGVTSNIDALGVPTGAAAATITTAANNQDSVGTGTVIIAATTGDVFLAGTSVQSNTITNLTAADGGVSGVVSLNADGVGGNLKLDGVSLSSSTTGTASAAGLTLTGDTVALDNATSIASTASAVDDPATAGVDESILDPDATALGSIGQSGNISITGVTGVTSNSAGTGAAVTISSSANNLDAVGAGDVAITTTVGNISLKDTSIESTTISNLVTLEGGSTVTIAATGGNLTLDNVAVTTSTEGAVSAGDIMLSGDNVAFNNATSIAATSSGLNGATADPFPTDDGMGNPLFDGSVGTAGDITIAGISSVTTNSRFNLGTSAWEPDPTFAGAAFAVTISSSADNVDSEGAGSVAVNTTGGEVFLANASIDSTTISNLTEADGGVIGAVMLGASGGLTLADVDVLLSSEGAADAGGVTVSAANTTLDLGTTVNTTSTGTGSAGLIDVTGTSGVTLGSGVRLASSALNVAAVGSGSISVSAGELDAGGAVMTVADINMLNTTIESLTTSNIQPPVPGSIAISATGEIDITSGLIRSDSSGLANAGSIAIGGLTPAGAASVTLNNVPITTEARAGGSAGAVSVTASGDVNATGFGSFRTRAVNFGCILSPPCPGGAAGSVSVAGANIDLQGTFIDAISVDAPAGSINFVAPGSIDLSGVFITADAFGSGSAGNMSFGGPSAGAATSVTIDQGSNLSSTARQFMSTVTGNAGSLSINAGAIVVDSATIISSQTGTAVNAGAAGVLTLTGNSLSIGNSKLLVLTSSNNTGITPGSISATITSTGAPGTGDIDITNSILEASTSGAMAAGDITLAAANITLDGGNFGQFGAFGQTFGSLESSTTSSGIAGNITLQGTGVAGAGLQTVELLNGADIRADASFGTASTTAGSILIAAEGSVDIQGIAGGDQVEISSSSGAAAGNAGKITITGSGIDISEALISSSTIGNGAVEGQGNAGEVVITDGGATTITNSSIESESTGALAGLAGQITLSGVSLGASGSQISATTTSDIDTSSDPTLKASIDLGYSGNVTLDDTSLTATTSGATDAGDITIDGLNVALNNMTAITATSTAGAGLAGGISITGTNTVTSNSLFNLLTGDWEPDPALSDPAMVVTIASSAASVTANGAGDVSINSAEIFLANTDVESTTVSDVIPLAPGTVALTSSGDVTLTGVGLEVSTTGDMNAGDLTISGINVALNDGTEARATSSGTGEAGSITVSGSQSVTSNLDPVSGLPDALLAPVVITSSADNVGSRAAGNVTIFAGELAMDGSVTTVGDITLSKTTVSSTTQSNVQPPVPGQVDLTATGNVSLTDVDVLASTTGDANAGAIGISGVDVVLNTNTNVTASANNAAGRAGAVSIIGTNLVSANSGSNIQITTSGPSLGAGQLLIEGGDILFTNTTIGLRNNTTVGSTDPADIGSTRLEATGAGTSEGKLILTNSFISGDSDNAGSAGTITLRAPTAIEVNSTDIFNATFGSGDAGLVDIATPGTFSMSDARLLTESFSSGAAGTQLISADVGLTLTDVNLNVITFQDGVGGSISLSSTGDGASEAGLVSLNQVNLVASTRGNQDAGNILIEGGDIEIIGTQFAGGNSIEATSLASFVAPNLAGAAGSITFTGDSLTMSGGAAISLETASDNLSNTPGIVKADIGGTINVTNSSITATATGNASAGSILLQGVDVAFNDGTNVTASSTGGNGDAGSITIFGSNSVTANVDPAELGQLPTLIPLTDNVTGDAFAKVTISSNNSSGGTGVAGSILITDSLDLLADPTDPNAGLGSGQLALLNMEISTQTTGTVVSPETGDILLAFGDQLVLEDTAVIASTSGAANAGSVDMLGGTSITITGTLESQGVESSTTDDGNAGSISFSATDIAFNDGATIKASSTDGSGNAGSITVFGSNSVTANVNPTVLGQLPVLEPLLDATTGLQLEKVTISSSSSGGSGLAGTILITDSADLVADSSDPTAVLGSGQVALLNTEISTQTASNAAGTRGDILIASGDQLVLENSAVVASTSGAAAAGSVNLLSDSAISVSGTLDVLGTQRGVEATSTAGGVAGTVTITGDSLDISGTRVSTATASNTIMAGAGAIRLESTDTVDLTNTEVIASTSSASPAGDITIAADGDVKLVNATLRSESTGTGDAGLITIAGVDPANGAGSVDISADSNLNSNTFGGGEAGDITILAEGLLEVANSFIESSVSESPANPTELFGCLFGGDACVSRGSGLIKLQGQQVNLTGTKVEALGFFAIGGDIELRAEDQISLVDSKISADSRGGDAGNVLLAGIDVTDDTLRPAIVKVTGSLIETSSSEVFATAALTPPVPPPVFIVLPFFGKICIANCTPPPPTTFLVTLTGDAGDVTIRGDAITLDSSQISSDQLARNPSPGFTTNSGSISFTGDSLEIRDGSEVTAQTNANVPSLAGSIRADITGDISLSQSNLLATTLGNSDAGFITLNSSSFFMDRGEIGVTSTAGNGNAGNITLNNNDFSMDGGNITVTSSAGGDAGNIVFNDGSDPALVLDTFTITSGGDILATAAGTNSTAGFIDINATGVVEISGSTDPGASVDDALATINSSAANGAAGIVDIDGSSIELTNSEIATGTAGSFAGPIASIAIGDAGLTSSVKLDNSTVLASTGGVIDAGEINISANSVALNNASLLLATADAGSTGIAGNITVSGTSSVTSNSRFNLLSGQWEIDPNFQTVATRVEIKSSANSLTSQGAGNVKIQATPGDVFLANAQIESTTISDIIPVKFGSITVEALTGDVTLTDTGMTVSTQGAMNAGNIDITADNVSLLGLDVVNLDGTQILASASSSDPSDPSDPDPLKDGSIGNAGSITITGTTSVTADKASISSSANNTDSRGAGRVKIAAGDILLTDSTISSTTASNVRVKLDPATGIPDADGTLVTAGTVDILATGDLTLDGVTVLGSTTGAANAGDVTLSGDNVSLLDGTTIRASAFSTFGADPDPDNDGSFGQAGSILITGVSSVTSNSVLNMVTGEFETDPSLATDGSQVVIESSAGHFDSRGAGDVTITSDEILLFNTRVASRTFSDIVNQLDESGAPLTDPVDPTTLEITATGNLRITDSGVVTSTFGAAPAGNILLTGNEVHITGNVDVLNEFGDPEMVPDDDDNLIIDTASAIARSASNGAAGDVTITSTASGSPGIDDLILTETTIRSDATNGTGLAGAVILTGEDILIDRSELNVRAINTSFSGAGGGGGLIQVDAGNNLLITGTETDGSTLSATSFAFDDFASIISGAPPDGDKDIDGDGIPDLQGGSVELSAGNVLRVENSEVENVAVVSAFSGDLKVTAPTVQFDNSIFNSSTIGAGSGGNIIVETNDFNMSGGQLSSSAVFVIEDDITALLNKIFGVPLRVGDAGNIDIRSTASGALSGNVTISNGGDIVTSSLVKTDGSSAGSISIVADGAVTISGDGYDGIVLDPTILQAGDKEEIGELITPAIAGIVSSATNINDTNAVGGGSAGSVTILGSSITLTNAVVATETAALVLDPDPDAVPASILIGDESTNSVVFMDSAAVASTSGVNTAGNVSIAGGSIEITGQALLPESDGSLLPVLDSDGLPILAEFGVEATSSGTATDSGGAGTVILSGNSLQMTDAVVSTSTDSNNPDNVVGSVAITIAGDLFLDNTLVEASTTGDAGAGSVELNAVNIDLANGTAVLATTEGGNGRAGDVTLTAEDSINLPAGMLVAAKSTGPGDAGSVVLNAGGSIAIDGASVESSSIGDNVGFAGSVTITGGDISLTGMANVSTNTNSLQKSDDSSADEDAPEPGAILITSSAGVSLDNSSINTVTSGVADAGDIKVVALDGDIDLTNNATVTAASSSIGDAGDVELIASGAINLPITTEVSAKTTGPGDAGSVALNATGDLTIDSAVVTSSSVGTGVGTAGSIELSGANIILFDSLTDDDPLRALVSTVSSSDVLDEANPGPDDVRPGSITLNTPGLVSLDQARISASVSGDAGGGDIFITANDLTLVEGSVIETRATGTGNSGSVTLNIANDVILRTPESATLPNDQSAILTSSTRSQGGTITANIGGVLFMDRSRIESSVETADGKGGDVILTTNGLFMVGSQILARAAEGNGGKITISRTDRAPDPATDTPFDGLFIIDSESLINADSAAGVSGEVNIDSPDADLTAVVEVVDARIVEDPTLADDICSPSSREAQSSFIVEDEGGVAPSPDGYFSAGVLPADATGTVVAVAGGAVGEYPPPALAAAGGCK